MITLSYNTKGLALLHQVEEIYGKVYTSDSLLETVLYWGINCTLVNIYTKMPPKLKNMIQVPVLLSHSHFILHCSVSLSAPE